MQFNPKHTSIKHPKRLIIIILSIIIVTGFVTYGFFSYSYWREFDQNSQKASNSLKTAIDNSLGSDKTSPAVIEQVDTVITNFENAYGTTPCTVSSWYGWETILPQLKAMRDTCDKRFATTLAVIKDLKPLAQFLKDEKKASELLVAAIEATKTPADYAAASATWKAVADSKELSTTDDFASVRTKSIEVSSAISAAYTALSSAQSKEDKVAFDTATTTLKTAYVALDTLKTTANEQRTKLVTSFVDAYKKL